MSAPVFDLVAATVVPSIVTVIGLLISILLRAESVIVAAKFNALRVDEVRVGSDAAAVVITDVYPAGEAPIPGIGGKELADGIRTRGHRDVRHIVGEADLAETVASLALPGDVVVCMGAGSISAWANALPKRLEGGAP